MRANRGAGATVVRRLQRAIACRTGIGARSRRDDGTMDPKAPLASRRTASRRRCTAYGFVLGAVLAICGAGLTHAGSRSSKALSPGHTETAAADIGLRTLLHSLESPVPTTRATAARSAARVAGELHQALVYASGDPDPATRTWSQLALALGGDSAGAEDVERTLGDPAPELREAALRALATSVPRERIPRQVVRPRRGHRPRRSVFRCLSAGVCRRRRGSSRAQCCFAGPVPKPARPRRTGAGGRAQRRP